MRFSHLFAKAPANWCSRVAFLEELNCIDIHKLAKSNRLLALAGRWATLFAVALFTGARRGELAAL
jgi:integrase